MVVAVTLTVTPAPPVTVSPSAVNINFQTGGANNTPQQTMTLSTTGTQAVNFFLTSSVDNNPSGANWILVNPPTGDDPGQWQQAGDSQLRHHPEPSARLIYTAKLP